MIIAGALLNFMAIWPHYSAAAYDRSVREISSHLSGPVAGQMIMVIPPINYYLIALGSALLISGLAFMISGARVRGRRASPKSAN